MLHSSEQPKHGYHPDLVPTLKDGGEPIRGEHGIPRGTLLGFWRWAYSQTLDNALRGVLAEYLVGLALGGPDRAARVEWDPHDVTTPDGIEIEVKSTAFLQSSAQQKTVTLSSLNSRVAPEKVTLTGLADAVRGAWD